MTSTNYGDATPTARAAVMTQLRNETSLNSLVTKDRLTSLFDAMSAAAFHERNPNANQEELRPLLDCYAKATALIRDFMKLELGYVQAGAEVFPTLNGRRMARSELSPGQLYLLEFIVRILDKTLSQYRDDESSLWQGMMVMIDEPENHLHPAALLDMLQRMRELVGDEGQIWLATHCLPLLSELEDDEIWTIENGKVQHPNAEQIARTIKLLVGTGNRAERFRERLSAPDQWAATKFISNCIIPPSTVPFTPDDPQLKQLRSRIAECSGDNASIRVLDIGAGRGRLASLLSPEIKNLEYLPVEPDTFLHPTIHGSSEHFLTDKWGIIAGVEAAPVEFDSTVDIAVLCNVLHEIPPSQWCMVLNRTKQLLKNNGVLLICEDQLMPLGERPHRLGYLVLGKKEFMSLFGLERSPPEARHSNDFYKERLLCISVSKDQINPTLETVKNAVQNLKGRMTVEVKRLREANNTATARTGREYGFLSQMLIMR